MTISTAARRATVGRRRLAVRFALAALVILVGGAVWLALATGRPVAAGPATSTGEGRPAPPFSLPALASGRPPVGLAAESGRPVMLSFFASWCTGCQQELRTMNRVEALAGDGVRIVGVDVNDTKGPARALLASDHIGYPVAVDSTGATIPSYDLAGLPTTIFLDARHRIVGQVLGPLSPSLARSWLTRIRGS